jgi:hypothetical protein
LLNVATRTKRKSRRQGEDQTLQQALRNVLSLSQAEAMARTLVKKAIAGDLAAINMCADRLDGKPHQSVEVTDERHDNLTERFEQILASAAQRSEEAHDTRRKGGSGKVN